MFPRFCLKPQLWGDLLIKADSHPFRLSSLIFDCVIHSSTGTEIIQLFGKGPEVDILDPVFPLLCITTVPLSLKHANHSSSNEQAYPCSRKTSGKLEFKSNIVVMYHKMLFWFVVLTNKNAKYTYLTGHGKQVDLGSVAEYELHGARSLLYPNRQSRTWYMMHLQIHFNERIICRLQGVTITTRSKNIKPNRN